MMPPSGAAEGRRLSHLRVPVPLPSPWFWGFVALYALVGLVGHDPWKNDDASGFGIAWAMANGDARDWLLPNIAGQYVAEEGPLGFWAAALAIKLFGNLLTPFDAARLSAAAWSGAALWYVHRAARELWGDNARHAALCLLACAGLLVRTHEISAEPALLFAYAYTLWAMVRWRDDPLALATGLPLALGLAMAWLARGPHAALPLALAVAGAPLVMPAWRNPRGVLACAIAFAAASLVWIWWPRLGGRGVARVRQRVFRLGPAPVRLARLKRLALLRQDPGVVRLPGLAGGAVVAAAPPADVPGPAPVPAAACRSAAVRRRPHCCRWRGRAKLPKACCCRSCRPWR